MNRNRSMITSMLISAFACLFSIPSSAAAQGDLDQTFGNGGKVVTSATTRTDFVQRVRIQPDGKIVTLGRNALHGGDSFVVRHNANGSLDLSFGTNGFVRHVDSIQPQHGDFYELNDFIVQANGHLFFSGTAPNPLSEPSPGILLHDVLGRGEFFQYQGNDFGSGKRIAMQQDGKLVVPAVYSFYDRIERLIFAIRYRADGNVDLGFGTALGATDPIFSVPSGAQSWTNGVIMDFIGDTIVQADGKIILSAGGNDTVLARLNPNGSLDDTFSGDGIVRVPGTGGLSHPTGIGMQSDGKIVVNGVQAEFGLYNSFILRFNPDGTLDEDFGSNGRVLIPEPDSDSRGIASALAIQPDGKILTAGTRNGVFAMGRFNTNGSVDSTFGANGILTTPVGTNPGFDTILSLALQPDGKLVAAGSVRDSAGLYDVALVRYLAPAETPPTVSVSGRVLSPEGRGLRNAVVRLVDSSGVSRTATTSSFGLFSFADLRSGGTYMVTVTSKRYRFEPRSILIETSISLLDFVGLE